MKVYVVTVSRGEYEDRYDEIEGVFAREEDAKTFAEEMGGYVEEHVLEEGPVPVEPLHRKYGFVRAQRISFDGSRPEEGYRITGFEVYGEAEETEKRRLGKERWPVAEADVRDGFVKPVYAPTGPYSHVSVEGTDKAAVAERFVAELEAAKERMATDKDALEWITPKVRG